MNSINIRRIAFILSAVFAFLLLVAFVSRPAVSRAQTISTIGTKSIIIIRADFPDATGAPLDASRNAITDAAIETLFTEVDDFFNKNSNGRTRIAKPYVTPLVVRMPRNLADYQRIYSQERNMNLMAEEYRAEARKYGYGPNDYDLDVLLINGDRLNNYKFAGLSAVSVIGDRGSVLTSHDLTLRVAAHELGHNFGLDHASCLADVPFREYGDYFDMMGSDGNASKHFNTIYKNKLGWLPNADVREVTASDTSPITLTLTAHDTESTGTRAIKIASGNRFLWIELRALGSGGVTLRMNNDGSSERSQLLDASPETPISDAVLRDGRPYDDKDSGARITLKSIQGTSAEVQVQTGALDCEYAFLDVKNNVAGFGGTASASVTTRNDCKWTPKSNDSWITVENSAETIGNGSFFVKVAQNTGTTRIGSVTIGNTTFSIRQGSGTCIDSITPNRFDFPTSGGTLNYSHSCGDFTVIDKPDWIEAGFNSFTASANSGAGRSYAIRVTLVGNGMTRTVTLQTNQAGQFSSTPTPTPTPTVTPTPTLGKPRKRIRIF